MAQRPPFGGRRGAGTGTGPPDNINGRQSTPIVGTTQPGYDHDQPSEPLDRVTWQGPKKSDLSSKLQRSLQAPGAPAPLPSALQGVQALQGVLPVFPGGDLRVKLAGFFLSRLPSRGLTFYHRRLVVAGASTVGAVGTVTVRISQLPKNTSLMIYRVVQQWYDDGLDPLDVNALTAFQSDQDVYGRVAFRLLINGVMIADVHESDFDPGLAAQREVAGWTDLNRNLIDVGNHPTSLYALDNATLDAQWATAAVPGHVPTAVGVEVEGYLVPTKMLYEVWAEVQKQVTSRQR